MQTVTMATEGIRQTYAKLEELITASTDNGATIKQELKDKFLPDLEVDQTTSGDNTEQLTTAFSQLNLTKSTKAPRFRKGENFSRHCERFIEWTYITKVTDPHLHLFFLQHVDDKTYSLLKPIILTTSQQTDAEQFCQIYKQTIYGDETFSLKNELMECKQKPDEKISDYVYRLREKANIAYEEPTAADENALIVFLRGIRHHQLKRKLNESTINNFTDAIKLAKRLERIDNMLGDGEQTVTSILKETAVRFSNDYDQHQNTSQYDYPKTTHPARDRYRHKNSDDRHNRSHSNDSYKSARSRSNSRDSSHSNRSHNWSRSPSPYHNRRTHDDRSNYYNHYIGKYNNYNRSRSPSPYPRQRDYNNQHYQRSSSRSRDRSRYSQYNNSKRQRRDSPVICWNCNKPGHVQINCRNAPSQNSYNHQQQYQRPAYNNMTTYSNRPDHVLLNHPCTTNQCTPTTQQLQTSVCCAHTNTPINNNQYTDPTNSQQPSLN